MAGRGKQTYEDFQPHVEEKEEQGANIVAIHLPGFVKDQISVTYVIASRTIKVQGERPLERNRRSRFNKAFPVPQNCIIHKIQGSFRNGIITITMPKKTITQEGSVKDANGTKEVTTQKPISQRQPMDKMETTAPPKAASTSSVEKQKQEKMKPPQTPEEDITEPKGPMRTGPQTAPPPKAEIREKKVEALQPPKQLEETQKKAAPVAAIPKQTEEKTQIVGEKAESKVVGLKDVVKEKESVKTRDSTSSETNLEKEKKDDKAGSSSSATAIEEEKPKSSSGSFLEKAKDLKEMDTIMKTVKKLATDDYEGRHLLLNIGVSVLVIVALGAYVAYSYRSSGRAAKD